jgi:hypothetical protein
VLSGVTSSGWDRKVRLGEEKDEAEDEEIGVD